MLDPDSPYVAYCPPGAIEDSRETLERGGHSYSELAEHQVLEGRDVIILIDTSVRIDVDPLPFEHYWWEAAFMKRRLSAPLIPDFPSPQIITGSTS